MGWIVFAVLTIIDFLTVFVILTGGRYFGQRLARWSHLAEISQWRGDESILDVGAAGDDQPL